MDSVLVSIIIPVYNTEKTLPRCVDSALAQTHGRCEIVIVDDGSPDGAGDIADDYSRRYDNIKVIHKKNAGLAEARRSGVKEAKGDYIIHLDSDDELLPDAVEYLLSKCQENNLDLAYGNYIRIDEKGDKNEVSFPEDEMILTAQGFLDYIIYLHGICANWGCLTKREVWLNDSIYPPSDIKLPGEDVLINIKISNHIHRAGLFNHPVCLYYYNSNSLSNTGVLSKQDKWKEYFSIIDREFKTRGLFEKHESTLLIMKIDRMAFNISNLDVNDAWVKALLEDKRFKLPAKTRLLQALIKHPRLWRLLLKTKRRIFN